MVSCLRRDVQRILPAVPVGRSLTGNTVPSAGTAGEANCHGRTVSAMAHEFGGIDASASTLGYSSVGALQDGINVFCGR